MNHAGHSLEPLAVQSELPTEKLKTLIISYEVTFRHGTVKSVQLAMPMEGIDWRQPKRLLTSLTML